jgi:TolB-like protein/Tfp pilus assembly protein PilF
VILAAGSLVLLLARRSENTSQRRVALAVLPFEDLGPDPVPDYFVDGLNEELITALSRVDPPRLGVIARSSVMRFRASAAPADQIGRDLGADYLLTGSFRFQDGRARISAQLIRTSDQTNIWGQSYDHAIADVLDVEREIAQAAARSLPIEPGVGGEEAKPTNPAARDAYLKGRYFLARGGAGPTAKALELFQQALQSDPGYAPAYLGKAEALLKQEVAAPEVEPEARALVRRALDLDDRSAEGHMLLARMKLFFDLDWPAARREFERAIELEPGRALTYHNYAFYFSTLGLHEQAIDQLQKALELDPISPALKGDLGWIYYYAGRYDEAIEQAFNTLQLQGEDLSARVCLIHCYLRQNNIAAALGRAREVMRLMGAAPGEIEALDRNDPAGGIRAYAGWRLKMFSEQATREYVDPALFAQAYLYLGRPDRAIAYLEAAHRLRSFAMAFLKTDPRYDSIRSDPRFARLVREVTAKAVESY